jgi:hypothetical protein
MLSADTEWLQLNWQRETTSIILIRTRAITEYSQKLDLVKSQKVLHRTRSEHFPYDTSQIVKSPRLMHR